jgi:hypothetical protein
MSQKNWLGHQVITNQTMSGTSVITSQITEIRGFDNVSYEMDFTGTPMGTFSVQVSNSYDPITNPNATFIVLSLSPAPVASGSSGIIGIDINQSGFKYIKLVYTNASGTGVLNAFISGKAI